MSDFYYLEENQIFYQDQNQHNNYNSQDPLTIKVSTWNTPDLILAIKLSIKCKFDYKTIQYYFEKNNNIVRRLFQNIILKCLKHIQNQVNRIFDEQKHPLDQIQIFIIVNKILQCNNKEDKNIMSIKQDIFQYLDMIYNNRKVKDKFVITLNDRINSLLMKNQRTPKQYSGKRNCPINWTTQMEKLLVDLYCKYYKNLRTITQDMKRNFNNQPFTIKRVILKLIGLICYGIKQIRGFLFNQVGRKWHYKHMKVQWIELQSHFNQSYSHEDLQKYKIILQASQKKLPTKDVGFVIAQFVQQIPIIIQKIYKWKKQQNGEIPYEDECNKNQQLNDQQQQLMNTSILKKQVKLQKMITIKNFPIINDLTNLQNQQNTIEIKTQGRQLNKQLILKQMKNTISKIENNINLSQQIKQSIIINQQYLNFIKKQIFGKLVKNLDIIVKCNEILDNQRISQEILKQFYSLVVTLFRQVVKGKLNKICQNRTNK